MYIINAYVMLYIFCASDITYINAYAVMLLLDLLRDDCRLLIRKINLKLTFFRIELYSNKPKLIQFVRAESIEGGSEGYNEGRCEV